MSDKPLAEQFREAIKKQDAWVFAQTHRDEILQALEYRDDNYAQYQQTIETQRKLIERHVEQDRERAKRIAALEKNLSDSTKLREIYHKRTLALEAECNRLRPIAHHCPDGKRVEGLEKQLRAVLDADTLDLRAVACRKAREVLGD